MDTFLPNPCDATALIGTDDYPKLHLLSSGKLMWADGMVRVQPSNELKHAALFLNLNPSDPDYCPDSDPGKEEFRWRQGVAEDGHIDPAIRGGNTAHLIARHADGDPDSIDEVVYLIGGTAGGQDDQPCPCYGYTTEKRVEKMVSPGHNAVWTDAGVPDLNRSRVNANTIALLDGSLLVVGGAGKDDPNDVPWHPCCQEPPQLPPECVSLPFGNDPCKYRRRPELYRPPELFGPAAPGEDEWQLLATQWHNRSYHSLAALLPDGRVVSIGGAYHIGDGSEVDHRFTLEIFWPPYLFWGSRPRILNPPSGAVTYNGSSLLQVGVRAGITIERFALLRNASVTHATDFNQRYVELRASIAPPAGNPPVVSANVLWAESSPEAPPGWYMLTAISSQGVPSVAQWVLIQ